ncbi:MAG TPA: hypothetical protein VKT31_01750 [Solirubrobacteraceae bacterium]|nr:hypothetical protein [Solirubrobacteraceae bacterium]
MHLSRTAPPHAPAVICVACGTYARPRDVPWPQHAVGCSVRTAQQRRELDLRLAAAAAVAGRLAAA